MTGATTLLLNCFCIHLDVNFITVIIINLLSIIGLTALPMIIICDDYHLRILSSFLLPGQQARQHTGIGFPGRTRSHHLSFGLSPRTLLLWTPPITMTTDLPPPQLTPQLRLRRALPQRRVHCEVYWLGRGKQRDLEVNGAVLRVCMNVKGRAESGGRDGGNPLKKPLLSQPSFVFLKKKREVDVQSECVCVCTWQKDREMKKKLRIGCTSTHISGYTGGYVLQCRLYGQYRTRDIIWHCG